MWEGSACLNFTILDIRAFTVTRGSHLAMYLHLNTLKGVHENEERHS